MSSLKAGAQRIFSGWLLATSVAFLPPVQAAGLRIGSVESIAPTEISGPRAAAAGAGIPGRRELRFDAFGRRFELQLEATPGLAAASTQSGAEAMQGTASGLSGSWVRLTKVDGRWIGLLFDGVEYFAVDSAGALAPFNETARRLPANVPVAFRLRDAIVEDASFAGDLVPVGQPLEAGVAAVAAELPPPALAATLPTRRLDVGVVLDAEQVARDGSQASAQALARMNVADGIFSSQVGVTLKVASTTPLSAGSQPFDTTVPDTLLDELKKYRVETPLQQAAGLTHLFTGRDLDGQTVGIAFLKSLCNATFSASLSEGRQIPSYEGLIAAHEIGHVFGAPHDGDAAGACPSTSSNTYLMAPQVNGSSTFSDCSLQQISPVVAAASCLAPSDAPDAALGAALQQRIAVGQASTVRVTVLSNGNATVNGVQFVAQLPAGVEAAGAGATGGGSCTIVPGRVDCTLGNIPAGESRDIEMSLTAATAGTSNAALSLTAQNDSLRDNDTSTLRLVAAAGADLGVSITFDPTSVQQGANTSARVQVKNNGLSNATDVALTVTQEAGLTPLSATGSGGLSCSVASGAVTCSPATLAAGAAAEVTLSLQAGATVTGAQRVTLHVASATLVDPQPGNNDATGVVTLTAPPPVTTPPATPPTSSGGGGGGGGALDALLLLALSGGVVAAGRRRRGAVR